MDCYINILQIGVMYEEAKMKRKRGGDTKWTEVRRGSENKDKLANAYTPKQGLTARAAIERLLISDAYGSHYKYSQWPQRS